MSRVETIGDATLYLGDCREILPSLGRVDAVVTSPPYNQLASLLKPSTGLWGKSDGGAGFPDKWKADGYADDKPESEYQFDQNSLFALIREACSPTASLFYNHQIRWRDGIILHPILWFHPDGWRLRSEIIWDRCGGMMFNARMFVRFDERILWFTASDKWKWNQESTGDSTIWRIPKEQNKEHPVAFPLELPIRCIRATTDRADTVMDPFCGGGTTGVAAVKLGRKFIGIEIEEKYFDKACRRIELAARQPDMFTEKPKPVQQMNLLD